MSTTQDSCSPRLPADGFQITAQLRGCQLDGNPEPGRPVGPRGQRWLVNLLRPARQAQVLERTSYDDRALECMRQLGIRGRKPGELRCARRWPAVAGRARGG